MSETSPHSAPDLDYAAQLRVGGVAPEGHAQPVVRYSLDTTKLDGGKDEPLSVGTRDQLDFIVRATDQLSSQREHIDGIDAGLNNALISGKIYAGENRTGQRNGTEMGYYSPEEFRAMVARAVGEAALQAYEQELAELETSSSSEGATTESGIKLKSTFTKAESATKDDDSGQTPRLKSSFKDPAPVLEVPSVDDEQVVAESAKSAAEEDDGWVSFEESNPLPPRETAGTGQLSDAPIQETAEPSDVQETDRNNEAGTLKDVIGSPDSAAEAVLSMSEYLQRPEALKMLIANPSELAANIAGDGASAESIAEALDGVMQHRAEVIAQLVAPEGLARGSKEVAALLTETTSEAINGHLRNIDQVAQDLNKIKRIERVFSDDVSQIRRTLRMFEDALQSRNARDIQDVAMRANRLRDFAETYLRANRAVKGMYDGGAVTAIRRGVMLFGENEHQSKNALSNINALHNLVSEDPESLNFEGVEDQIVSRGLDAADELQSECAKETERAEQAVGTIKRGSEEILGSTEQLMRQVNNPEVIDAMVHPRMIEDGIDQFIRTLRRVAEGQMDVRRAQDQLAELQQIVNRTVRSFEAVPDKVKKDLRVAESVEAQLTSLKRQVQQFER